jgi:integrase
MWHATPQARPYARGPQARARRGKRRCGGAQRSRLDPRQWTPRELRHSFVSLMSDAGVPVEQIARLVGHSGTMTTETVYRKQIRPVLLDGADVMDRIFSSGKPDA